MLLALKGVGVGRKGHEKNTLFGDHASDLRVLSSTWAGQMRGAMRNAYEAIKLSGPAQITVTAHYELSRLFRRELHRSNSISHILSHIRA